MYRSISRFSRFYLCRRFASVVPVCAVVTVFLTSSVAHSYEGGFDVLDVDASLGLIKNVSLNVEDKVSGQCWTNADEIKQQSGELLKQSGLQVYDEPLFIIAPFSINLTIRALGERAEDGECFGSLQVESFRKTLVSYNGVKIQYRAANFSQSMIASGSGRGNLNQAFLQAADDFVSMFSERVDEARKLPVVSDTIRRDKTTYNDANAVTLRELANLISETIGETAID